MSLKVSQRLSETAFVNKQVWNFFLLGNYVQLIYYFCLKVDSGQLFNTTYKIPRTSTIPADNTEHKVNKSSQNRGIHSSNQAISLVNLLR